MAVSGKLVCSSKCGYESDKHDKLKFYDEVGRKVRGRQAVKVNTQLQVGLTKQPIGNTAVRQILASIEAHRYTQYVRDRNAENGEQSFRRIS